MSEKIYKYVPYSEEKRWEAVGWVYAQELGPPHAAYASLWMWPHDGEPVIPETEDLFAKAEREKNVRDFDEIFGLGGDGE